CLQATGGDEKDQQADGGDGEGDIGDKAQMRRGDAAYGGDEHEDENEDVEEFFENDGAENDGGRGAEIAGVGEDTHDIADAEGENVVGGKGGHEDASADEEVGADGTFSARHHLGPADAAEAVAGECEAEYAEEPCGMYGAKRED